ncbi:3537_t:CDS:2 [Dentiscutata heterogama]|uniref:3537_t:CDS:1 n=1 Tax=Dentiscutata heterogama TaxID=1316150 RepID=A0ACA9L9M1_9GLOM|nr:3537_t:CDS:2 [Dentiscutata heterogama]
MIDAENKCETVFVHRRDPEWCKIPRLLCLPCFSRMFLKALIILRATEYQEVVGHWVYKKYTKSACLGYYEKPDKVKINLF